MQNLPTPTGITSGAARPSFSGVTADEFRTYKDALDAGVALAWMFHDMGDFVAMNRELTAQAALVQAFRDTRLAGQAVAEENLTAVESLALDHPDLLLARLKSARTVS